MAQTTRVWFSPLAGGSPHPSVVALGVLVAALAPRAALAQAPRAAVLVIGGDSDPARTAAASQVEQSLAARGFAIVARTEVAAATSFVGAGQDSLSDEALRQLVATLQVELLLRIEARAAAGAPGQHHARVSLATATTVEHRFAGLTTAELSGGIVRLAVELVGERRAVPRPAPPVVDAPPVAPPSDAPAAAPDTAVVAAQPSPVPNARAIVIVLGPDPSAAAAVRSEIRERLAAERVETLSDEETRIAVASSRIDPARAGTAQLMLLRQSIRVAGVARVLLGAPDTSGRIEVRVDVVTPNGTAGANRQADAASAGTVGFGLIRETLLELRARTATVRAAGTSSGPPAGAPTPESPQATSEAAYPLRYTMRPLLIGEDLELGFTVAYGRISAEELCEDLESVVGPVDCEPQGMANFGVDARRRLARHLEYSASARFALSPSFGASLTTRVFWELSEGMTQTAIGITGTTDNLDAYGAGVVFQLLVRGESAAFRLAPSLAVGTAPQLDHAIGVVGTVASLAVSLGETAFLEGTGVLGWVPSIETAGLGVFVRAGVSMGDAGKPTADVYGGFGIPSAIGQSFGGAAPIGGWTVTGGVSFFL